MAKEELDDDELEHLVPTEELKRNGFQATLDEAKVLAGTKNPNKQEKFRRFIDGLQEYSGIIDTAIQHQPETISLVWAAVKFLLKVRTSLPFLPRISRCRAFTSNLSGSFSAL